MKKCDIVGLTKNAMGTVFLLAGAFFVCSTFLSMRAVFADPIAPVISPTVNANTASPRANSRSSRSNAALRARTTNAVTPRAEQSSASRANDASVSRANPSASVSRSTKMQMFRVMSCHVQRQRLVQIHQPVVRLFRVV